MSSNELILLRRKEVVGTIAVGAMIVALLLGFATRDPDVHTFAMLLAWISGWALAAVWVAIDTEYRRIRQFWWTLFTILMGPLGLLLYALSRPAVQPVCAQCGSLIEKPGDPCPMCERQTLLGKTVSTLDKTYTSLVDSFTREPVEKTRDTTRQMAIACAAVAVFGLPISILLPYPLDMLARLLWIVSVAAYWVLSAWWVYLDASWRRMEPVPWGILTLVTNIFGLVTYLVIRHPDPRVCVQCGSQLNTGLKRCPYCGVETEPACPRCQASVKPDWVFCPACAAKLPGIKPVEEPSTGLSVAPAAPSLISIRGTVVDAVTGSAISSARVKIDSKNYSVEAITDDSGRFALSDLDPQPYVVTAEAEGYSSDVKAFQPGVSGSQVHFSLYRV